MRPVRVPGADGAPMPGYLTLPSGHTGRNLPAVVLPHGGPYSRDSWGFDPLVQLLASRGYAVLQVNYRGSTGYGEAWLAAGFQGWGTVMHDDITAAARWLVADGIADPRRLCIVGWSYGGYAALIGAVKQPDLYRCAVSIAGVSDLKAIAREDNRFYGGAAAARQSTGTQDLDSQSPRARAAEIKAPVLLVHGHADVSVVVDHSEKMADALKRAGKPHELLVIRNGDHSLRMPAMRQALYERLAAFLAANLGTP
jgi:dipeptidyl aminopeptidase/acylaminoacyl peptidase